MCGCGRRRRAGLGIAPLLSPRALPGRPLHADLLCGLRRRHQDVHGQRRPQGRRGGRRRRHRPRRRYINEAHPGAHPRIPCGTRKLHSKNITGTLLCTSTSFQVGSPLNLSNADSKPYLWTVDNSPIYGSPDRPPAQEGRRIAQVTHAVLVHRHVSGKGWRVPWPK